VSATLTVKRESVILELRRGTIDVELDGAKVGSVESHETFTTSIEPGSHTLQLRTGRYTSQALPFVAGDGDSVDFRGSGARIWPIFLISLIVPSLALSLKRE
jgi:hypothetical protein